MRKDVNVQRFNVVSQNLVEPSSIPFNLLGFYKYFLLQLYKKAI